MTTPTAEAIAQAFNEAIAHYQNAGPLHTRGENAHNADVCIGIVLDRARAIDAARAEQAWQEGPFRNMKDGATLQEYRDQLAVGNLTPVDQMAFDNVLHDLLDTPPADGDGAVARIRNLADELASKTDVFPAAANWAEEFRVQADILATRPAPADVSRLVEAASAVKSALAFGACPADKQIDLAESLAPFTADNSGGSNAVS